MHLLKIKQRNIFETTVAQRPKDAVAEAGPAPAYSERHERPFAVATDMTPEQASCTRMANYPHYDWPSVDNLVPRKRGHNY